MEGYDDEAMDRLETNENTLYRTALLQRLLKVIRGGGFWNIAQEDQTRDGGLRGRVEVKGEVRVGWGGGGVGG